MHWLLSALALLLLPPIITEAAELDSRHYRIEMPLQLQVPFESREQTPWGSAATRTFLGTEPSSRMEYHFTDFAFDSARPLNPKKLSQAIRHFLHQRKCVAQELKQAQVLDAKGNAWPQIAWAGRCADGTDYRNIQLIAYGRLYEMGVSRHLFKAQAPDLDHALRVFAATCHFVAPKDY